MTANLTGLILIVDDTLINLDAISTVLSDAGYEIAIATTGERALHHLQRRSPDLILLDVMMPGMDGFETCKRIKADPKSCDIPIIFMTSLTDINSKIQGFQCGAVDYITKPFQEQEVLARVSNHLQLRLLTQNLEKQVTQQTASLRIAKEALEKANISKCSFLSTMSKEIRTPINAILQLTTSLQEEIYGKLNAQQIEELQKIDSNGAYLLSLINNTLKLANIESGQFKPNFAPTAVDDLCRSCLVAIQAQADKKNIILTLNIESQLPKISIDEHQIRQVIINLLSNALKFTSAGRITLSITKGRLTNRENISCLRIAITDTGIGIAPENIKQLFQPFVQIHSPSKEQPEGTGLGLILVKQIVELHGGQVSINSIKAMGSCFTIELPSNELAPISSPLSIHQSDSLDNSKIDSNSSKTPNLAYETIGKQEISLNC
jgi:signal transduction histidine kinase